MRCIFLVTLFSTLYGFIILNDNWPKTAVEVGNEGKVTTLRQLLENMDAHYNLEINVDHHDHDVHSQCGDHEHGEHDEHDEHHGLHGHHGHDDHHGHEHEEQDHIPVRREKVAAIIDEFKEPEPLLDEGIVLGEDEAINLTESELEHQAQLYEEYIRELEQAEH